jgi:hypothetical protein
MAAGAPQRLPLSEISLCSQEISESVIAMLAHIGGIPIEETALSLAPIAAATGLIAGLKLREQAARWRLRKRREKGAARWA